MDLSTGLARVKLRVLITGGSGFIGTNLVSHFTSLGFEVCNFDIVSPRNPMHIAYWRPGDLLDYDQLRSLIRDFDPEVIFHMAARTDLDGGSIEDYAANTMGVKNLIAAVDGLTSLRRMIFASSRLVCRIGYAPKDELDYCPSTPYGESKVLGEKVVRDAILRLPCPALIVRPTSIWGPWFDVPYKTFFLTISRGQYFHPGSARVFKSFGFIGNTIQQLERLMVAPVDAIYGKTFYLADYPPIEVTMMANSIQQTLGLSPIKTVPISILRLAARVGDGFKILGWKNPPLTSFRLNNLLTPMLHELEPLQVIAGTLPFSMERGVEITLDWLKAQGDIS